MKCILNYPQTLNQHATSFLLLNMPPEKIHLSLYGNRVVSTQFLATLAESLHINAARGTAGKERGDEFISILFGKKRFNLLPVWLEVSVQVNACVPKSSKRWSIEFFIWSDWKQWWAHTGVTAKVHSTQMCSKHTYISTILHTIAYVGTSLCTLYGAFSAWNPALNFCTCESETDHLVVISQTLFKVLSWCTLRACQTRSSAEKCLRFRAPLS